MSTAENLKEFYSPEESFRKSNYLINSRFNASLLENQILTYALANVKETEDGKIVAYLTQSQIKKVLNKNYKDIYRQIRLAAERLLKVSFFIEQPETRSFVGVNVVSVIKSTDGDLTVTFNRELKDQILNLKTNYTTLNIKLMTRLSTLPSFRLYEVLSSKMYYKKNYNQVKNGKYQISFDIDHLRCLLNGVKIEDERIAGMFKAKNPDYAAIVKKAMSLYEEDLSKNIPAMDKYPKPKWLRAVDFRKQVIEPAIRDINEEPLSDMNIIAFEDIKTGSNHKTVGYTFYIEDLSYKVLELPVKETNAKEEVLYDLIDEIRSYIPELTSTNDIVTLLKDAENDVEKVKKAYRIAKSRPSINGLVGFMRSAIINCYEEDIPVKGGKNNKNAFHFSNQRDYDYDELEKQIINR